MYIGIDIGGTKCAVILGTKDGEILAKRRFPTTTKEETLAKIFEAVAELEPGKSIGISCGGPLDEERGRILSPPNLPGWDDVPIVDMLVERFGVPAMIHNDANACAVAEWKFGIGKGTKNFVFMTFGTGLGAGLILNGQLYSGSKGFAGELGHIRLADHGPAGYGKCGSFEGFCSGAGLRELGRASARAYLQKGIRPAFLLEKDLDTFDVVDIAEAARQGDECAKGVFELSGTMLGQGLAIVYDMLDPELVAIGSVYARCQDLLGPPAEKELRRLALGTVVDNCRVVTPILGEKIGDMAALAVAMEVANELY